MSPDPDLNTHAREYFTRHMRIVEQVMEAWPMPELQAQVDTVREAFSADVNKPFVLKASFPYSSPQPANRSPASAPKVYRQILPRQGSLDQPLDTTAASYGHFGTQPVTPPISTGPMGSANDSPAVAHMENMMAQGGQLGAMPMAVPDQNAWNPSKIFE